MLKLQCEVTGLKELNKTIKLIENLAKLQSSSKFQKYIQKKSLEIVKKITDERLTGGTTNDGDINLYKKSHHIQKEENGFILYNDAKVLANISDKSGYPDDKFSIALAFEYGTGTVGLGAYGSEKGYKYNDLENSRSASHKFFQDSWFLPKNVLGESGIRYYGYQGFEIYRFTAEEIRSQLPKWVNDYIRKYGGVSK